ncbi:hypothetical protein FJTKL_00738 [Diaporthe vaccinii]|uniref:Protein kinase domain-containing protein n=1 Tax=Diaporthe vaccinii TaxID=105482 RepID=A0ABR4F6E9_9PEZI
MASAPATPNTPDGQQLPVIPPVAWPPMAPPPPNAQAPLPSADEGRATTKEIQKVRDRFEHYWNGQYEWWREEDRAGRRRAHYTRLQVPKPRPPEPRPNVPQAPPLRVNQQRIRWRQSRREDPRNLRQYVAEVQNGKYQIMNFMRPLGFRLLKILGKGGFGMACLFEMTDVDGKKHKIVVKAGTGRDLQRERTCLRRLAGARHILQQQMLRGLPQPESIEPTPPGVRNIFGGNPPELVQGMFNMSPALLGLEFMKHGDVHNLTRKAGSHPKTWRSQELWLIWHCLFRGCVALAYPDTWSGGRDPLQEDIVLQEERIPLVNGQAANHDGTLVHFDIEPQNVMVGNYDDPNTQTQAHLHNVTPIFKIGDMGIAESFTEEQRRQLWPLLRCRNAGKKHIFTPVRSLRARGVCIERKPYPIQNYKAKAYRKMSAAAKSSNTQEQNTREWDYLDNDSDLRAEPTAGQYNWGTNLYQAALIMYQLILNVHPDEPPQCSLIEITGYPIWTYGGLLVQDKSESTELIDYNLRFCVAACMAHVPEFRPNMTELEESILQNINMDWATKETQLDKKFTIRELLRLPKAQQQCHQMVARLHRAQTKRGHRTGRASVVS